ncbi:hypothetical protein K7432_001611 [Basidiobolus ranarum]|uniref:Uncharacterized protein n=1 Tax=Basidiobolus ranarum TaxID=34480 RepID=A0ABR2W976_9FUNG
MSTNHEIPLVKLEIVPSQTEVREESIQAPTKFQAPPKFQEPPLNLFLESTSNLQEKGKCSEKKKTKQTTEYRNVRTIPRSDRNKVPVSYEISDTKYMYKIVPNVIPKTDRKAKKSKSSKGPRISTKLFSRLLTISGPVEQPNPVSSVHHLDCLEAYSVSLRVKRIESPGQSPKNEISRY